LRELKWDKAEQFIFAKILEKRKAVQWQKKGGEEMDERLKNIMDNLDSIQIGLDDPFKFHCTCCAKCCIHREDILLNPKDIYNMSKELGISPEELFKKYCEAYVGDDSRVPIVRIKPRGSVKRCPLLKERKCLVHKSKPSVCAMFPIGRFLQAGDTEGNIKNISVEDVQYIFTRPDCGDTTESHTVREWLGYFGIPIKDEFFIKWQKVIIETSISFRKLEKKVSPHVMELAWTAAFAGLYLHYDMEKEFMLQFEENAQNFQELLHKILKD